MKLFRTLLYLSLAGTLASPVLASPHYAVWKIRFAPSNVRAGEGARIVIIAAIQKPWHIYSLTQPSGPSGGPTRTTITLLPGSALVPSGSPVQPPPKKVHDAGFNITDEIYQGKVAFGLPVTVKPGTKGYQTAHIELRYQLCNANTCLLPEKVRLTISFTVASGGPHNGRTKQVTITPKTVAKVSNAVDI